MFINEAAVGKTHHHVFIQVTVNVKVQLFNIGLVAELSLLDVAFDTTVAAIIVF